MWELGRTLMYVSHFYRFMRDQFLKTAPAVHPPQRLGEVAEVSQVIVWLSSDQSSFVNGVCVPIDGGRHATTWGCLPPPKTQ